MKKNIWGKINNNKGESLAEVLVALLISSLAILMLSAMIGASGRMITRSKVRMQEYYEKNNELEMQNDANAESEDYYVQIKKNNTNVDQPIRVKMFKNEKYSKIKIYAYKKYA